MEKLSVKECIDYKKALEKEIARLVDDFQAITDLDIDSIGIEKVFFEANEKSYTTFIRIKVTL